MVRCTHLNYFTCCHCIRFVQALAQQVPQERLDASCTYPHLKVRDQHNTENYYVKRLTNDAIATATLLYTCTTSHAAAAVRLCAM
jgi:hypothetical protein